MALVATRTPGRLPSSTPSGTPTATVMASPTAHASTVAPMSAMNRPLPASSTVRHSTEEVSGSAARLMMPSRPAASASSKNTTIPVAPRAHRPIHDGRPPPPEDPAAAVDATEVIAAIWSRRTGSATTGQTAR